ncbi:MAG: ribosome maturation factor RimM [Christensenellales bacterium]|jgi:16S rRNA processing protein RimM
MIEIAKIVKAQGIGGELKTHLFSENYEEFSKRGFAYLRQGGIDKRITYETVRTAPPYVYLRIDGINTRNDAEELQGVFLYLDRKDFAALGEGEYYVCDLLGLTVVDKKGEKLGQIKDVLQYGAADVYVVDGERGFMFPALKRVIDKVDIRQGIILVNSETLAEVAVYDDV